MSHSRTALLSTAFWAAVFCPLTPAWAQSADVRASSDDGDIVVTARKREESLLKVPVIATVLQEERLERLQVVDLKDVTKLSPGLLIGTSVLSIGQFVSIRGVGTSSADPGIDQSVSLNIDGLSLGQGLAFSSGMFDVQQVEVLKGPQALFYGKSSPGGVISIRTADPGDHLEVTGRVGYEAEARTARGEAVFSTPLTSTLGFRLAGMAAWSDGYYFNKAIAAPGTGAKPPRDSREGSSRSHQLRGTLLWKPSSQFDARLKVNLVKDRSENGENFQMTSCPEGVTAPLGIPFIGGGEDCKKDRTARIVYYDPAAFPGGILFKGIPTVSTLQRYATLEMNYQPTDALTLTSVTGYYNLRSRSMLNTSFTTFAGPALAATNPGFRRRDFTQELRLGSDFSGPLNFTVGAFYQNGKVSDRVSALGNVLDGLPPLLQDGLNRFKIETYSVFGQARWKIAPELELAAGARWTDETRKQNPILFPSVTDPVPGPLLVPVVTPKLHSSNVAPEATLTYTPTDDLTVFASYKKGYKSGSFSIATPQKLLVSGDYLDNSFGDESVEGFEGGVKGRLADRQLTFTLAGFRYSYKGLQVGTIEPVVSAVPIVRTVNAGSGRAYGAELDLSYRPRGIEGLDLRGTVSWTHARFKTLNNVPCFGGQTIALGCSLNPFPTGTPMLPGVTTDPVTGLYLNQSQDLSGTRFVRSPDWQASFGFDYELPVGSDKKLILTNNNNYSSKFITGLGLRDDFFQKSFFKVDLGLTLADANDAWEVAVIGKNITKRHTASHCNAYNAAGGLLGGQVTGGISAGPAGIDENGCYMDPGREIWVRLTLRPSSRR